MRRKGMTAISLVISAGIVLLLMLLFLKGMPGMWGGSKALEELDRRPGKTIPEAAMNKARGPQCMSNLRQIRLALQMLTGDEQGRPPASLGELSPYDVTADILSCPVSGNPYPYDPSQAKVWCTTTGHEGY